MSWFNSVEQKTHLYFYDDNSFEFIKRELKFQSLVVMVGEELKKAWKHFYSNQIPFAGYKNIPADMITLGFSRDIILDPFDKVPEGTGTMQKPNLKDKTSMDKWITNQAENQRHIYRAKRAPQVWTNRITWALICVLVIMVMLWAIAFARNIYV
jgi:hypothetical protein